MAETNNINTNGAAEATAALRTPRAQKREVAKKNESGLSVRDLILIAVLLAAGAVLKLTVSSFFSFAGMKPNFIIAMYCLAIILVRPKLGQSLVIGLLAGLICQIPMLNATPWVNIPSEMLGALACGLLIHVPMRIAGKVDLNQAPLDRSGQAAHVGKPPQTLKSAQVPACCPLLERTSS